MLAGILALAASGACLLAAALAWSGRWRSWSRGFLNFGALPITLLPGLAAGALAGGLNNVGAISASSGFGAACFIVMVAGVVLAATTPRWWGPRWYRQRDRSAPPDVRDPLIALGVAAASGRSGTRSADAPALAALGRPLRTWRGSWILGDETDPAAHGLTHAGAVGGRLSLYRDAVAFSASGFEDLLRDHPTVLTIPAADLRRVRVVPAGAGPDGRSRPAAGARSVLPRLVLERADEDYLFEVQSAGRTARRIREGLGIDGEASLGA